MSVTPTFLCVIFPRETKYVYDKRYGHGYGHGHGQYFI